jgi:hypothetical protein
MLFVPTVRAQQKPCCSITRINTRTDLVEAKVNATGEVFEFKVTNPALLQSLKAEEALYANFTTQQVSVDGRTPCGTIVSIASANRPLASAAPGQVSSARPAPQPGSSPKVASSGSSQSMAASAASGANPPCCGILRINAATRLVNARDNSGGRSFQFSVPSSLNIHDLQVGQPVWANFKTRQASLDGRMACCSILSLGTVEVTTAPGTTPESTMGSMGLPTPTSVVLSPASVTGGAVTTGTLNLTGSAPQGGIQVAMSSGDATVAVVPQTVVVAFGTNTGTFTVSTKPVPLRHVGKTVSDAPVPVVISASTPSGKLAATTQMVTQSATLDVLPPVVKNLEGDVSGPLNFNTIEGLKIRPCTGSKVTKSPFRQTGDTPTHACVQLSGPAADESQRSALMFPTKFRGAAVALSSSNPQIASVPATVFVPEGKETEQFAITTVPVQSPTSVTISAQRVQSDTKTLQITVLPPVLQGFQCSPQSRTGGNKFSCTVTLSGPAYAGLVVQLDRNCDPLMTVYPTVPGMVAIAAGSPTATFTFSTIPVATDLTATIEACFGGDSKSASLTIEAPRPYNVTFNPNPVTGGNSSGGKVYMNGPAPTGGIHVTLSSSNAAVAAVPAIVSVATGASVSASFTVTTERVTSQTDVSVSASYAGTTIPGTLTVTPPPQAQLTVSFLYFYVNNQAVQVVDLQAGQAFSMCIDVKNIGHATSRATAIQVVLTRSDGTTLQTWVKDVPQLPPGTVTGANNPCIDVPALDSGYSYDFNGVFEATNSRFYLLGLSF